MVLKKAKMFHNTDMSYYKVLRSGNAIDLGANALNLTVSKLAGSRDSLLEPNNIKKTIALLSIAIVHRVNGVSGAM